MLLNLATTRVQQQRSRKAIADRSQFVKIREYVYENCLDHIWRQTIQLPVTGERPHRPCTGNYKKSMGLPCIHDLWLLRKSGQFVLQLRHIHPH